MLVEVRFKNYYSMVNETKISMQAEALSEHKYSLLNPPCKPSMKVVPIKLFYGASSVEKQKIVLGLKLIHMLISEQLRITSTSVGKLSIGVHQPVQFGITVAVDQYIYDYDFAFQDNSYVMEVFKVNSTPLFERGKDYVKITKTPKTLSYYDDLLRKHLNLTEKLFAAKGEYLDDRLFLTSLFSCYISPKIIKPFLDYIDNKLMFFDDSKFELSRRRQIFPQLNGNNLRISSIMQGSTDLLKLMLQYCLKNGMCLIVSDNNTSFDPLEVLPYLKGLHNINLNQSAQLLMFSYQTLFMHRALIRRDEVCFINLINQKLQLSSLSQYAEREENYIKKYLLGEYINTYNYRAAVTK